MLQVQTNDMQFSDATQEASNDCFSALSDRWKTLNETPSESSDDYSDVLRALSGTPASDLSTIIEKLEIWKSAVCPEAEDEMYVQMIDKIVLSVLRDLKNLSGQ